MRITLYPWRRKGPLTGRWRVLRWKMTDEDAKQWAEKEGAELEKVPGSDKVRSDAWGQGAVFSSAQSTGAIEQHFADLGAKLRHDHRNNEDDSFSY